MHGTRRLLAIVVTMMWYGTLICPALADEPRAAPPADPFVEAVAKLSPSIVGLGVFDRREAPSVQYFGTGFVVDDGKTVVTNAHVVEAIRQKGKEDLLRVFFVGGSTEGLTGRVVSADRFHDVALVVFDGPAARALTLDSKAAVRQGASVGVLGYPIGMRLGLVPAAHRGVVSAVVPAVLPLPTGVKLTPELAAAMDRPYNLYQLDLTIFPGNSGSPLFDAQDGRVIGIINKTLATRTREHMLETPSGISYAVPIAWAEELIAKLAMARREMGAATSRPTR